MALLGGYCEDTATSAVSKPSWIIMRLTCKLVGAPFTPASFRKVILWYTFTCLPTFQMTRPKWYTIWQDLHKRSLSKFIKVHNGLYYYAVKMYATVTFCLRLSRKFAACFLGRHSSAVAEMNLSSDVWRWRHGQGTCFLVALSSKHSSRNVEATSARRVDMVDQCRPLDGMSISFSRCPVPQYISIPSVIPNASLQALWKNSKNPKRWEAQTWYIGAINKKDSLR